MDYHVQKVRLFASVANSEDLLQQQGEPDQEYRTRIDPNKVFTAKNWSSWSLKAGETPRQWNKRQHDAINQKAARDRRDPQKKELERKKHNDRKKRRLDTSTELEPLTAGQYEPYASGPPSIALEPFNPESAGQSKCAGQYEPHAAGLPSTTLEPVFEPMAPESGQYDTHPFPEVNNSSDNPTKKIYDCRSIIDWKRDFDEICLEGETAVVHAYCPWLDNMPDDTKNLLIQESTLVKELAIRAGRLADSSNEDVLVFTHEEYNRDEIRKALAENKCVFIKPPPGQQEPILDCEWLETEWSISVDVDSRQPHSMRRKSVDPGNAHTGLSSIRDVMSTPLDPQGDHLFVLDCNIMSYGMPKETRQLAEDLIANQEVPSIVQNLQSNRSLQALQTISVEHLNDQRWALLHMAMTNTRAHHDTIGKVAQIEGQAGLKLWFVMYADQQDMASFESFSKFQTSFMIEEEEKYTYPEGIKVYAFLITPGAILLQPPGVMHAVYTPIPSFVTGSSFWSYDTLHLTRPSRLLDVEHGDQLTNVNHDDTVTFDGLLRMMILLPTIKRAIPKNALLALVHMVLFPFGYIITHKLHDNAKDALAKKRKKGKKAKSTIELIQDKMAALGLRRIAVQLACVLSTGLGWPIEVKAALAKEQKHAGLEGMERELREFLDSQGAQAGPLVVLEEGQMRTHMQEILSGTE